VRAVLRPIPSPASIYSPVWSNNLFKIISVRIFSDQLLGHERGLDGVFCIGPNNVTVPKEAHPNHTHGMPFSAEYSANSGICRPKGELAFSPVFTPAKLC